MSYRNKYIKVFNLLLTILATTVFNVYAQDEHAVKIIAKAEKDSILIRWAPNTPISWEEGNEKGYVLKRVTIVRDENVLPKPEVVILTEKPLLPLPYEAWEALAQEHEIALVAAQALYGEKFAIDMEETDMISVYQKSREDELRYSFSLFAADQSIAVAKGLGLFYVDKTAKKNEKYLYQVDVPDASFPIDSGSVFISLSEYKPLPSPYDLSADVENNRVLLKWKYALLQNYYNSYWVERAEGTPSDFKKITEAPVTITYKDHVPDIIYKSDSFPNHKATYFYRVRGIDAFGEIGPSSDTLEIQYIGLLENNPVITKKENINNEQVFLQWEYPHADSLNLAYFQVLRGLNDQQVDEKISDNIESGKFTFIDKDPGITNYYKVAAFDASGKKKLSMPVMVQLIDSVPPDMPLGLLGKIVEDSVFGGLVALRWDQNQEKDMAGYRIYRGNNPDEEFSLITPRLINLNTYTDTIRLNNLSGKIYYKIMAVDKRQNHSALSETLMLIKPDKIPPVPPVWKNIENSKDTIYLSWHPSSSKDVRSHKLFRSLRGENNWQMIYTAANGEVSFDDSKLEKGQEYSYTIIAVDESYLESEPAKPVIGRLINTGVKPEIKKISLELTAENFVRIKWNYKESGVTKYSIYKGKGGEPLSYYASIDPDKDSFIDNDIIVNQGYQYKIKASFEGGAVAFSDILEIKTR